MGGIGGAAAVRAREAGGALELLSRIEYYESGGAVKQALTPMVGWFAGFNQGGAQYEHLDEKYGVRPAIGVTLTHGTARSHPAHGTVEERHPRARYCTVSSATVQHSTTVRR